VNHLGEKLQKFFYTIQYFGSPEEPPGPKVTGLGGGVPPPFSYLQNFVPFWRPLSKISAAKLRRFWCRSDPQNHRKHTVNDMSPHYTRRQLYETFSAIQQIHTNVPTISTNFVLGDTGFAGSSRFSSSIYSRWEPLWVKLHRCLHVWCLSCLPTNSVQLLKKNISLSTGQNITTVANSEEQDNHMHVSAYTLQVLHASC